MSTTQPTEFPSLVITTVDYLFDPGFDKKRAVLLLPHRIFGAGTDRVTTVEEALEVVFRQLNAVDGNELISEPLFRASYQDVFLRSMSVGDVVTFRGPGGWRKQFVCEGCGWAEITEADRDWLVNYVTPRDFWGTFAKTVEKSNINS
jgi:hypothetical protein